VTHVIDRIYELEIYREALRKIGKLTDTQRQQIAAELAELRQRLHGATK
jgi:mRNA-degrading endonuclease RelE of RelBE toxin-antitoxin system